MVRRSSAHQSRKARVQRVHLRLHMHLCMRVHLGLHLRLHMHLGPRPRLHLGLRVTLSARP